MTASSLNRSKQRVQSAVFLFFFLSVTSSLDLNGPLTLAAVHVYRLKRMRRCYDVIRSDVYVRKHEILGVSLDFHSQRCLLIEAFDHHASIFLTYSGKIYPSVSD